MNTSAISQKIREAIANDDRLWTDDAKTILNETKLIDLITKLDQKVIENLLDSSELREKFFVRIKNSYVFNINEFKFFIEENTVDNSYTQYSNRIGLASGRKFLKDNEEVVLNFPFKDCILEGGQSNEEGQEPYYEYDESVSKSQESQGWEAGSYNLKKAKRKEIFFNQILAKDEIDRLFDPKAMINWKRYTKDGEGTVDNIKRDEHQCIKENLIIKGNNLLALYSLKGQFLSRVKLVYIDPPYNTGSDGFVYNDSFNRSTWLTFMKNRLEVAWSLLKHNGAIVISIDDGEFAHLKILCDELFGSENFLSDIIWNSTKSVTNTAIISTSHTHNLIYFKDKEYFVKNRTEFRLNENGQGFANPDNDYRGPWKADPFQVGGWRPNQQYEITNPNTGVVYTPNKNCSWKNDFEKFQKLLKDNRIVFGKDGTSAPQRKRFLSEAKSRGKVAKTIWDDVGTTTNGTQHLKKLFGEAVFNNSKPETFIKRIIELTTSPGDIVLDYHLGSGTTASTAHKMGRQYIGIEQMDYIESVSVERLKKVLQGEQGGISEEVDWKGGGDFIYCELAKWNEAAKDKIDNCNNLGELIQLFDELYIQYFLNYNVKIKEFREKVVHEKEFQNLKLEQQKNIFITMLDINQMYVNFTEMASSRYSIKIEDQKLTSNFHQS